jgi:uncharacterized membrane protein YhiD involved in acid resistance
LTIHTNVHVAISLAAIAVLIVQSFQKVPALKAMAPTQSEPPFMIAQVVALVAFLVLGSLAAIRFRDARAGMA